MRKKTKTKKPAFVTRDALPAMPIARMLAMVPQIAAQLDGDAALLMRSLAKALETYRDRLFAAVKLANDERDAALAKLEKVRSEAVAPTYDKWKDRAEWLATLKMDQLRKDIRRLEERLDQQVDLQ